MFVKNTEDTSILLMNHNVSIYFLQYCNIQCYIVKFLKIVLLKKTVINDSKLMSYENILGIILLQKIITSVSHQFFIFDLGIQSLSIVMKIHAKNVMFPSASVKSSGDNPQDNPTLLVCGT